MTVQAKLRSHIQVIEGCLPNYFTRPRLAAVSKIERGIQNYHYRIELEAGGQYFVKLYRDGDVATIEKETHLAQKIFETGFVTPQLVPTRPGLLFSHYRGTYVALFEYISGSPPSPSLQTMEDIGLLIVKLQHYKPERKLSPYYYRPQQLFSDISATVDKCRPIKNFLGAGKAIASTIPFTDLPRSFVHCDVTLDNLLRVGNRMYVIDFEHAGYDNCLFDLSRSILYCCRHDGRLSLALANGILDGFQRLRNLTKHEWEYFYEYLVYLGLLATYWRYMRFNVEQHDIDKQDLYKDLLWPTLELMRAGKAATLAQLRQ